MNDIKLALLYQKIDNNNILNDPVGTLYYGARIKNPDLGIHYTFLKSPNGDIGLLRTENTDQIVESISNLVEVCVEETKKSPVKLTFLLKWNSNDNITTWGDTITNEFLLEFSKSMESLKITVPSYNVDKKKYKLSPITTDENIAISFKVTEGRDILYLKEAIPELFRRIYQEELTNIDNINKLFKDSFLEMDLLKANDSRQDNDVIKSSISTFRSEAIRKNINDWIDSNKDLFQNKYYKYEIDTTKYSDTSKCYVLLESKNLLEEPIISSEVCLENASIYIKHMLNGMPLEAQIRYASKTLLDTSEEIKDHTFIMYGGQKGYIYSSSSRLLVKIVRISETNKLEHMVKQDATISEYIHNKGLIFKQNGRYYTFSISGTPAKRSEVCKLRDYIWRMATKSGWGAGWGINNTDALKQDRDLGDACNTRTIIPLSVTLDELKQFDTLNIYIDDWYAVASGGGNGGIHYYSDYTGRMCYQGYAVYGNNEASIPTSKLNLPLVMDNEAQAQSAHLKLKLDMISFKWDGSWNRIYNAPTGIHGLSVSQTRRKNRLLGGFNFRYYLRIRDNKYLELLCEYQQNADGDKHDNCYTQGAARMSMYIHGFKPNSMKINIIDYFTKETVYSYPATDIKMSTPALQIHDLENNYLAYLNLSDNKNDGFNILDTATNKIYYAKEISEKTTKIIHDRILIDNPIESLNTLNLTSEDISISAVIHLSKVQKYEFKKDDNPYIDKIYYSTSEQKYYQYNEKLSEYIPVEYEDFLNNDDVLPEIIDASNDDLHLTEFRNIENSPQSLYRMKSETLSIDGEVSNTLENILNNNIKFYIPSFDINKIQEVIINNDVIIEFVVNDGKLNIFYNKTHEKYLIDVEYSIEERMI